MLHRRINGSVGSDKHANGSCTRLLQPSHLTSCRRHCHHINCVSAEAKEQIADQETAASKGDVERSQWAASVRAITGRNKHMVWQPQLDPPPLLSGVSVVLVGPKRPRSVGVVARALNSFECVDLRVVEPRCNIISRGALTPSRGSQWVLYRATVHDDLAAALVDTDLAVAFTRWAHGRPNCYTGMHQLLAAQHALVSWPGQQVQSVVQAAIHAAWHQNSPGSNGSQIDQLESSGRINNGSSIRSSGSSGRTGGSSGGSISSGGRGSSISRGGGSSSSAGDTGHGSDPGASTHARPRVALVFGREDLGLTDEEIAMCGASCSLPTGRLQESLSLSHAVVMALSSLFEQRLLHLPAHLQREYCVASAAALSGHETESSDD